MPLLATKIAITPLAVSLADKVTVLSLINPNTVRINPATLVLNFLTVSGTVTFSFSLSSPEVRLNLISEFSPSITISLPNAL